VLASIVLVLQRGCLRGAENGVVGALTEFLLCSDFENNWGEIDLLALWYNFSLLPAETDTKSLQAAASAAAVVFARASGSGYLLELSCRYPKTMNPVMYLFTWD
jgi:hypothetical protein